MYYKAAVKLRESSEPLFQQLRRDLETVFLGQDDAAAAATPAPVSALVSASTQPAADQPSAADEIDRYLADQQREATNLFFSLEHFAIGIASSLVSFRETFSDLIVLYRATNDISWLEKCNRKLASF